MQALRKTQAAAGLDLVDVALPTVTSADDVLVRVLATGICGSDLHVYDWTPSYAFITASLPVTLGHEFVGVLASGADQGRRVVVRPSVTCGRCAACVDGNPDACDRRTGLGMTRDGAFAPWVRVPARNCVPVPEGLSDELAALAEPVSISMQALRVAGDVGGKRVLVMGPGTIGQGIAVLARRAGAAQVVISGFNDGPRLDVLRRMGFDAVVDVAQQPLAAACAPHTGAVHTGAVHTGAVHTGAVHTADAPFDVVFEATGVPETINEALPLLARNGVVVVTGIHSRPLALDLTTLVRRQHQLRGSFRPPESDWPKALALLDELGDTMRPMVSHVLPLQDAAAAFALAHGKQASKVLLRPDHGDGHA